jgi:tetratricopeptide (TPR) repeat protein
LPLFDSALARLSRAYRCVEELQLDQARDEFKEYLRVFPTDPEVTNAYSSLQWLGRRRPRNPFPGEQELYNWWRRIERDARKYRILHTALHRRLKYGVLKRLVEKLAASGKKTLNGVHIGLFYFELEQFPEAVRELRVAAGEQPDSSLLLGALAEALYRTGHRAEAEAAYGLALLYEPQKCGFEDFSHPAISSTQARLKETGMGQELARENLLVQCWLEGVLRLPPMPSVISLRQLTRSAKALEPKASGHGRLALVEDARLFRWCLQAAQWIRAEAAHLADDLAWAERKMEERDARAFQAYEERARLEELQEEETVEVQMGVPGSEK